MVPSRQRRSIQHMLAAGVDDPRVKLYKKVKKAAAGNKAPIKTHCRDFVILPEMIGLKVSIHNGKEFIPIEIKDKMVGHFLGEFALTRKMITHSSPGVGATRSTKFVSVRA
jgi:small subunit ribosomal protein S19